MKAPLLASGSVDAGDSPPEKENARPGEPGTGSSGERSKDGTCNPDGQAVESAFALLCKAWMRCDRTARFPFLATRLAAIAQRKKRGL